MPNTILEKEVTVYAVTPVSEIATGDTLYQVAAGEYVKVTPDLITRVGTPPPGGAKEAPAAWILFNIKKNGVVPYKVGSKWKLTVFDDGTLQMVTMAS